MTIPDFTLPGPTQPWRSDQTQNRNNAVTMSITKNTAFTGVVTTSALGRLGAGNSVRLDAAAADLQSEPLLPRT